MAAAKSGYGADPFGTGKTGISGQSQVFRYRRSPRGADAYLGLAPPTPQAFRVETYFPPAPAASYRGTGFGVADPAAENTGASFASGFGICGLNAETA